MALEDALLKLAEAINNHAEALKSTAGKAPVAEVKKAATSAEADTPASTTKVADTRASDSKKETTKLADASTTVSKDEPDQAAITAEATAKFADLIDLDLDKAKDVLTELGFPKFRLVPANLHAKALELTIAALAEV